MLRCGWQVGPKGVALPGVGFLLLNLGAWKGNGLDNVIRRAEGLKRLLREIETL